MTIQNLTQSSKEDLTGVASSDSISDVRNAQINKLIIRMTNSFLFQIYLIRKMPIAWIAGMRLRELDRQECTTSMPFRWLSQNPFKSVYFATQAMSAELSTGALALLAVEGCKPSVAMLITGVQASYTKKANQCVYYTCTEGDVLFNAVQQALGTGEAQTAEVETVGRYKDGTEVSRFKFKWSFKART